MSILFKRVKSVCKIFYFEKINGKGYLHTVGALEVPMILMEVSVF